MSEEQKNKQINVLDAVVSRISEEHLKPHSKTYWRLIESLVWSLWVLTIIIGSLAVAVLLFASIHASFELYEVRYNSFFDLVMDLLPLIWIGVMALALILAYYNMRHTKFGYRYSLLAILLTSVGASILGGFALHMAGAGYYLDTYLGRVMPMYHSQEAMSIKMWHSPENGRLVGKYLNSYMAVDGVAFIDVDGVTWQVSTEELKAKESRLLETGDSVRIVGLISSSTPGFLHICSVFPWMLEKPPAMGNLQEQRRLFLEKINQLEERFNRDGRILTNESPYGQGMDCKDLIMRRPARN